jgi:hypothetical protein
VLAQLGFLRVYDMSGGWGGNATDPGWVATGGPSTTVTEPGHAHADLRAR